MYNKANQVDLFTAFEMLNNEEISNNKETKFSKAVKRWVKTLNKQSRECLKYSNTVDGIQYTSDQLIAFALNEGSHMDIEQCPEDITFPEISGFFPKEENGFLNELDLKENPSVIEVDYRKNVKIRELKYHDSTVYIDNSKLNLVLDILGKKGIKCYTNGLFRPILFVSDKGKAIVMPIRKG